MPRTFSVGRLAEKNARIGTRKRRPRPALETLERRLCLSTTSSSGVDALSLGDVNGDRVADIAVASHQNGHAVVTVYSGWGKTSTGAATGFESFPLVTLTDPLGAGSGPLSIALGDFSGTGVSQLAVASTGRIGGAPKVALWGFQLLAASPVNAPVSATMLTPLIIPSGMSRATGLQIAAADLTGQGQDQLIVAPTGLSSASIAVFSYQGGTTLTTARRISAPFSLRQGASVSAGDVTGDGVPDLVAGSKGTGQVSVYDGAKRRWTWSTSPLGRGVRDLRVTAVSGENTAGSVVVTGTGGRSGSKAAIVPYKGKAASFTLPTSPGSGALVPLGAGYVYQRSTVKGLDSAFPYSDGPVTPTVIFGATSADQLVVQGFRTATVPSKVDVYVEPLWNPSAAGFIPLQPRHDPAATGKASGSSPLDTVPVNLIAYPEIDYQSPYEVKFPAIPGAPPVTQGLYPFTPYSSSKGGAWGPDKTANTPPTIPSTLTPTEAGDWLRQRVVASLVSFIGADYQHHHDPRWLPTQGSAWNATSTVAYQSQGVDCTNLTAFVYADAMGIMMNSATGTQASITPQDLQGTTVPASMAPYVQFQTIDKSDYNTFIKTLKAGDILYIYGDPSDPSQATHGITWLGEYGIDAATGQTVPLVIDATGITPQHVDANNQVVPEGVHIRPFGPPGSLNSWYYDNVGHALRIIKD